MRVEVPLPGEETHGQDQARRGDGGPGRDVSFARGGADGEQRKRDTTQSGDGQARVSHVQQKEQASRNRKTNQSRATRRFPYPYRNA